MRNLRGQKFVLLPFNLPCLDTDTKRDTCSFKLSHLLYLLRRTKMASRSKRVICLNMPGFLNRCIENLWSSLFQANKAEFAPFYYQATVNSGEMSLDLQCPGE